MSQQQKTAVVQSVCLNLIQRTRRVGGASLGHLTSLLRETQSAAPCVQQRCKQQAQSLHPVHRPGKQRALAESRAPAHPLLPLLPVKMTPSVNSTSSARKKPLTPQNPEAMAP